MGSTHHANSGLIQSYSRGLSADEISRKTQKDLLLRQDHTNLQNYESFLKTLILDSISEILLEEQKDETLRFGDKNNIILIIHL